MNNPAQKRIFVMPVLISGSKTERKKVRFPEHKRHLKQTGEAVVLTSYWIRRKDDGDVVFSDVPEKAITKKRSGTKTVAQNLVSAENAQSVDQG